MIGISTYIKHFCAAYTANGIGDAIVDFWITAIAKIWNTFN